MIKLLIGFSKPQAEWLRQEAERLGLPGGVSELARRAVDAYRKEDMKTTGITETWNSWSREKRVQVRAIAAAHRNGHVLRDEQGALLWDEKESAIPDPTPEDFAAAEREEEAGAPMVPWILICEDPCKGLA